MKRSLKDHLGISLRGVFMGAADVVPGVSGGTIAFITGIYEELLNSISAVNGTNIKLLFKGDFKGFWKAVNGSFFVFLLAGVAFSVLSLAKAIGEIVNHPEETKSKVLLWSFFFGLILASIIYMIKQVKQWKVTEYVSLVIGALIAYYITIAVPANGSEAYWFIFLAGFIAICAMILPGISGSFILLLIGAYPKVIGAIKDLVEGLKAASFEEIKAPLITVAVFGTGCVIGLLSFARLVSYLFKKSPNTTLAVLTGFLIGSLNKVWPWKLTTQTRTNSEGHVVPFIQENISPSTFAGADGSSHMMLAIVCAVVGFALVLVMEYFGEKLGKQDA